ncbi:MAG: hypothetical protein ACRCV9_17890 [Burkholderiaceae bacterium]
MKNKFNVGDEVIAQTTIWKEPSGDSPGGVYATAGTRLIVRKIGLRGDWSVGVSHQHIEDNYFCVAPTEICLSRAESAGVDSKEEERTT